MLKEEIEKIISEKAVLRHQLINGIIERKIYKREIRILDHDYIILLFAEKIIKERNKCTCTADETTGWFEENGVNH